MLYDDRACCGAAFGGVFMWAAYLVSCASDPAGALPSSERRSCSLRLRARFMRCRSKRGCAPSSLRATSPPASDVRFAQSDMQSTRFVQALVAALRIAGLPLLIALGALGVYASAEGTSDAVWGSGMRRIRLRCCCCCVWQVFRMR